MVTHVDTVSQGQGRAPDVNIGNMWGWGTAGAASRHRVKDSGGHHPDLRPLEAPVPVQPHLETTQLALQ